MAEQVRILTISCIVLCWVGELSGGSVASSDEAVNALVSPDLFGERVDIVTPGFVHWSASDGDVVDPDGDANDIDNNFGEHGGAVTDPKFSSQVTAYGQGSVAEEFVYAYGDNTVRWEFKVPGAGQYVMATRVWSETQERTAAVFSYRSGGKWIDLPKIDGVGHWGGSGKLACFLIEVPPDTKTIPVRVRAASGRVLVLRVLLARKRDAAPFLTDARPTHPSMHFHADEVAAMRRKIKSGPPKAAYGYMLNRSEEYIRSLHAKKNNKWTARRSHHHVGRALAQTAFLHVLSGDQRYYDEAMQMVSTVMSWKHSPDATVGHYSILTRGRNLSMVALIYDWFYQKMPASDRDRVRRFMVAEANRLYLYNETGFRMLDSGNWDPWIGAGYGMVGIALKDEHKWARDWIESMKSIFHVNLAVSGEDFGYFNNGFTKAIDFGICLKTATGEDIFRPNAKRLRALLEYRMMLLDPQREGYPSFGDASSRNDPMVSLVLGSYQRDPLAQWYIENLSCRDVRQVGGWGWNHMMPLAVVAMYDPALKGVRPGSPRVPLGRSFANDPAIMPGLSAVTVMRTGYDRDTDVQLTMRCGPFFGWHSHPDQGSFILKAHGDTLTIDRAMGGTYGTPANDFSKSALSHSQVLIDGYGQIEHSAPVYYDNRAGYTGPLTRTPFVDYILAESSVAYRKNPKIGNMKHADRHFLFIRKPNRNAYLVIIDDVQKDDKTHRYDWLLQTGVEKIVTNSGNTTRITGKAAMDIVTIEPEAIEFSTSEHFGIWRTIKISGSRMTERGIFMTVLYPRPKMTRYREVKQVGGDGFIGASVENDETFLFSTADSPIEAGGIRTDAKIVAIGREEGKVAWLLCVDGTRVECDGKELLKAGKKVTAAFNATRIGAVTCAAEAEVRVSLGSEAPFVLKVEPGTTAFKGE